MWYLSVYILKTIPLHASHTLCLISVLWGCNFNETLSFLCFLDSLRDCYSWKGRKFKITVCGRNSVLKKGRNEVRSISLYSWLKEKMRCHSTFSTADVIYIWSYLKQIHLGGLADLYTKHKHLYSFLPKCCIGNNQISRCFCLLKPGQWIKVKAHNIFNKY